MTGTSAPFSYLVYHDDTKYYDTLQAFILIRSMGQLRRSHPFAFSKSGLFEEMVGSFNELADCREGHKKEIL